MVIRRMQEIDNRMAEIQNRFNPPRTAPADTTHKADSPIVRQVNHQASQQPNRQMFSSMLDKMIEDESAKQGVSSDLIKAVVKTESNGNPKAVSSKGAIGLMQLMPSTAASLGVDPNDSSENLEGGIRFLKQMAHKYGDLDRTLAAYNAGPGAVDRFKGVPPFEETRNYVSKIKRILKEHHRP